MTAQFENGDNYSFEVNEITQGINTLVTKCRGDKMEPSLYGENSTHMVDQTGFSPTDGFGPYRNNKHGNLAPSQRNNMVASQGSHSSINPHQTNLQFQSSTSHKMTGTGPRYLSPDMDPSLKRISDLSISSSTSYSSQSSTDEISSLLRQTHIAVYKFNIRHDDEVSLEVGDAVCLYKEHNDSWFEGTNLRTGQSGVFPSRYVSDILQTSKKRDSISSTISSTASENTQFYLRFLGSVEVQDFKGNEVLCTAMKEIVKQHQMTSVSSPPYCTLDICLRGIKITEHQGHSSKSLNGKKSKSKIGKLFEKDQRDQPESSHFFDLKNVTFCGCHPNNARYFAFITKHPEDTRFACHVFMSEFSTEPVAYSVGKAFKDFYNEFLDYQA